MQSYDLGCSYGGGSNPASVLTDAGLSFVSQSSAEMGRRGMTKVQQQNKCLLVIFYSTTMNITVN